MSICRAENRGTHTHTPITFWELHLLTCISFQYHGHMLHAYRNMQTVDETSIHSAYRNTHKPTLTIFLFNSIFLLTSAFLRKVQCDACAAGRVELTFRNKYSLRNVKQFWEIGFWRHFVHFSNSIDFAAQCVHCTRMSYLQSIIIIIGLSPVGPHKTYTAITPWLCKTRINISDTLRYVHTHTHSNVACTQTPCCVQLVFTLLPIRLWDRSRNDQQLSN